MNVLMTILTYPPAWLLLLAFWILGDFIGSGNWKPGGRWGRWG